MSATEVMCPKCGKSTDAREAKCASCGVDLLAAFEGRALGRADGPTPAPAPKPKKARPAAKAGLYLLGLLLCGAAGAIFLRGLWILKGPESGKRLPERVYADQGARFAFTPPSGWNLQLLDEDAGAGLRRRARLTRGTTSLEVCVGEPRLLKEADAALLKRALTGVEPVLESAAPADLDGLPARRLQASGGRVNLPSANAGKVLPGRSAAPAIESVELAALVVAGGDGGTAFVIKAFGDRESLEADRSDIERWLASFRVLNRPWRP